MKASLLSAALLFVAGETAACGYCVEDKIAATYDHTVVTRALEDAASMAGVEKASVRISPDLLTVSLAFDARQGVARCSHTAAGSEAVGAQTLGPAAAHHAAAGGPGVGEALTV